jgi:hypothetical protein
VDDYLAVFFENSFSFLTQRRKGLAGQSRAKPLPLYVFALTSHCMDAPWLVDGQ